MAKSFEENFREWAADNRYEIAEDCGAEREAPTADPTSADRSSTSTENVTTHST